MQRYIPSKKCLETLSLFSRPEFPEKGWGLLKLVWSRDVTERLLIILSPFFSETSGWENKFKFSKNFLGGICLFCWMSFQPQHQNENKKYQKLCFEFSYCKLPHWLNASLPLSWKHDANTTSRNCYKISAKFYILQKSFLLDLRTTVSWSIILIFELQDSPFSVIFVYVWIEKA